MNTFTRLIDATIGKLFIRYITKSQIHEKTISAAHFNYLTSQLSNGKILPYSAMSISPLAMIYIINHILIHKIQYMVEFGTGISTIFLNNLITKNNLRIKIISIDHDINWQATIKNEYQLNNIEFIHAPLNSVNSFNGIQYNWYNLDCLQCIDKSKVEFVVIDGPIGIDSPYERAGAFEFFKNELERENFSILLDDSNYPALREIMNKYLNSVYIDMGTFSMHLKGFKYNINPVLLCK
jgi:hypothetical protein